MAYAPVDGIGFVPTSRSGVPAGTGTRKARLDSMRGSGADSRSVSVEGPLTITPRERSQRRCGLQSPAPTTLENVVAFVLSTENSRSSARRKSSARSGVPFE